MEPVGCQEKESPSTIGSADGPPGPEGRPPSVATLLVRLAQAADLFHTPDSRTFATVPIGDHRETWELRSREFRYWLSRCFYKAEGRSPHTQALLTALEVLEGQALFEG